MKKIEVSIKEDGVTVTRSTEEHLSAEQKFSLLMALLAAAAVLGFFWMMTGH